MWPGNLKCIELVGGMTFTEMWMLKSRIESGSARMLQAPEKVFGNSGKYYTIYGDAEQQYTICTHGNPARDEARGFDAYVCRINKLTLDQAERLLSGWPFDEEAERILK